MTRVVGFFVKFDLYIEEMEEIDKKNKWNEFLEWINNHNPNTYYRGESDKYLLMPKVGRKNYSLSNELNMFEHFKRRAGIYCQAKNDFEWLALAQHHGLPTRLLDWTLNPLVACYFAVITNKDKSGRIYYINSRNDGFVDMETEKSPFNIRKIKFLHPPISTRRIELQKGIFSIHPLPNEPILIGEDYGNQTDKNFLHEIKGYTDYTLGIKKTKLDSDNSENELFNFLDEFYNENKPYFEIPSFCKTYFEHKIRLLGIDETIFGDIDSISKNIIVSNELNLLKPIIKPSFNAVIPFWEKNVINNIVEYLETKNNILENISSFKVFDKNFYFKITGDVVNYPKTNAIKEITGDLYCEINPNYDSYEKVKFIDLNYAKYKSLDKLIKIINPNINRLFSLRVSLCFKLKIKVFCNDFIENDFSIVDILPINYNKEEIKEYTNLFTSLEKNYFQVKSSIDSKDFEKLINNDLNDEEIEILAKKNKIILPFP